MHRGGAARRRADGHRREGLAPIRGAASRYGLGQREEVVLLRRLHLHEPAAAHVRSAAEAGRRRRQLWRVREHEAVAARHLG